MPEFHAEPYIYLAGLSHKSALIAWGAFYFRTKSNGRMKIVDDHDLQWIHPPRCDSIGCRSKPFGPAEVEVKDESGTVVATALTNCANHVAISGLKPDTRYIYSVNVKHEPWASGIRWDWNPAAQALQQTDGLYRNEFRTLPNPTKALDKPFTFAVIGAVSWASTCHFLLVTISGDTMAVRAIGESSGELVDIERFDVDSNRIRGPIVIARRVRSQ